jgi:hypothetical protein
MVLIKSEQSFGFRTKKRNKNLPQCPYQSLLGLTATNCGRDLRVILILILFTRHVGYLQMMRKKTKNLLIHDDEVSLDRVNLLYYYKINLSYT